jgi:hypothetical protein
MDSPNCIITSDELLEALRAQDVPAPGNELRRLRTEPLLVEEVTSLELEDFYELALGTNYNEAKPLAKLRASHHELARLLAASYSRADASIMTGYSVERIAVLCLDPTFADLVANYRARNAEAGQDITGQLLNVALDSLQEFRERLESRPEQISSSELIAAAKLGFDRAGHGPSSTQRNVSISAQLSAEELFELEAKARAQAQGEVKLVESRTIYDENTTNESQLNAGRLLAAQTSTESGT